MLDIAKQRDWIEGQASELRARGFNTDTRDRDESNNPAIIFDVTGADAWGRFEYSARGSLRYIIKVPASADGETVFECLELSPDDKKFQFAFISFLDRFHWREAPLRQVNVEAILRTVLSVLGNPSFMARGVGIWLCVVFAANIGMAKLKGGFPVAAASVVVVAAALIACAINTHRFILINETPGPLRLSPNAWRYFFQGIWANLPAAFYFGVLILLVELPLLLVGYQPPQWMLWSQRCLVFLMRVFLEGMIILPRSLVLPSVALGQENFTSNDGQFISVLNKREMMVLALFSQIPYIIEMIALFLLSRMAASTPTASVLKLGSVSFVEGTTGIIDAVVFAAVLSCCYAGLVESRPEFLKPANPSVAS